MPVGAKKSHPPELWRVHLEDMLARADEAIAQAEMRIKRHSQLPAVDGEPWQKRLHSDVHNNLQQGLKLLCLQRAMVFHELYGPRIPRRFVADKSERIGELREVVAWLDALPKGTLAAVVEGQRQRAIDELARLQNELKQSPDRLG